MAALVLLAALAACGGDTTTPAKSEPAKPVDGSAHGVPTVVFHPRAGGTAVMQIEVADTEELQSCGLMHRLSLPADQGMLFVFDSDRSGPFWNRNTFIPLTLAWIAADGTIIDLTDMANVRPEDNPQINAYYAPRAGSLPYRHVIEANQGWFTRHGVTVGDRVDLGEAIAHGSRGAVPICREKGL